MTEHVERGSATLWIVGLGSVLATAVLVATGVASLVAAQHRADTAADLAALSAVTAGTGGAPACGVAARISQAHRARMVSCTVSGVDVQVEVEVVGLPLPDTEVKLRARARAGPSQAVGVPSDLERDARRRAERARADRSRARGQILTGPGAH